MFTSLFTMLCVCLLQDELNYWDISLIWWNLHRWLNDTTVLHAIIFILKYYFITLWSFKLMMTSKNISTRWRLILHKFKKGFSDLNATHFFPLKCSMQVVDIYEKRAKLKSFMSRSIWFKRIYAARDFNSTVQLYHSFSPSVNRIFVQIVVRGNFDS